VLVLNINQFGDELRKFFNEHLSYYDNDAWRTTSTGYRRIYISLKTYEEGREYKTLITIKLINDRVVPARMVLKSWYVDTFVIVEYNDTVDGDTIHLDKGEFEVRFSKVIIDIEKPEIPAIYIRY